MNWIRIHDKNGPHTDINLDNVARITYSDIVEGKGIKATIIYNTSLPKDITKLTGDLALALRNYMETETSLVCLELQQVVGQ